VSGSAAVADAPPDEKPGLEAVPDQEDTGFVIDAGGQITLDVGGNPAEQSSILFAGGEVKVAGEFKKGERVRFEIEGVVSQVAFIDLMDQKTGSVTATKRKHTLKLDDAKVL
jgi:hypothetical protein